jgi:hypothetical protein
LDPPGLTREALEGRNYKAMLGLGTSYGSASQLADPKTVLPFLYVSFGAPAFFVGLLYPLVQAAGMITQLIGAPVFGSPARSRQHQMLSFFLMGSTLATLGLFAPRLPGVMLVLLFLVAALFIGGGRAINTLAWSNLMRRIFSDDRRNALLYAQSGLAGFLTVPIALLLHAGIHFQSAIEKHMMLLWVGATIMLFSGILLFLVREPADAPTRAEPKAPPREPTAAPSFIEKVRTHYLDTLRAAWFRDFVLARLLLLSVELAPPFYAIHAATFHKNTGGSLNTFVAATGIAYFVGAPLWRRAGRVSDGKVLVLGALLGAGAGFWAMAIEYIPSIRDPLTYAIVFFLIAFANIGVSNARTSFLLKHAPADRQSYFVGLSSTTTTALGIVVALGFGAMAHLQGAFYAVCLIIGLNIATALFCARMRTPHTA